MSYVFLVPQTLFFRSRLVLRNHTIKKSKTFFYKKKLKTELNARKENIKYLSGKSNVVKPYKNLLASSPYPINMFLQVHVTDGFLCRRASCTYVSNSERSILGKLFEAFNVAVLF